MSNSLLTPQPHIVFTEFEEKEAVLVDLNAKRYYTLNETAMLVWNCLEKGCTKEEILREMTSRYNVTPEHARASLENLLGALKSHMLLQ